ncbi:hypothetical protein JR316_0011326 [Psilocybe cubensis]|uniref:Uncharacterized protein n=2 Tax=Psilocybe cubensis TaxID=181762 RepID=A0ACB8GK44_PSICU|nr:hypothetical protein JR316_0011326 [Psilocybe cubensis]KAH9475767.1 hypothetical protein JR316_0011326 [Psilocybe cubensis]
MTHTWVEFGISRMETQFQLWLDEVCDDRSVTHATDKHVLHIKIGPTLVPADEYALLEFVEMHILRHPYLQSVNVTAFLGTWSRRLHDEIEGRLNLTVTFRVRLVDPERYLEYTQTSLGSPVPLRNKPSAFTRTPYKASVTFALDGISRRSLLAVSHLNNISRLTVRGPYSTKWRSIPQHIARASENIVNFLVGSREALRDLEEVTLSLDFQDTIDPILVELQQNTSIATLTLTTPTRSVSPATILNTAVAIQSGMVSIFPKLVELILPTVYVNANNRALGNVLDSRFEFCTDSRVADGGVLTMFYNGSGLRLVSRKPLIFLPVKLY